MTLPEGSASCSLPGVIYREEQEASPRPMSPAPYLGSYIGKSRKQAQGEQLDSLEEVPLD